MGRTIIWIFWQALRPATITWQDLEGTPDRCTVGLWSTDKADSEGTQLKEESVYSLFSIPSVCFTLCFSIPSHLSLPNVALFSTSDRGFRTMFFCQPLFSKDRCLWQIGEDLQEPTQQWKLGLKKKNPSQSPPTLFSIKVFFQIRVTIPKFIWGDAYVVVLTAVRVPF